MTTTINASTSAGGGLIQTADSSGILALQTANTTAVTIGSDQSFNFSTTGQRITGDFSNATVANRVMFQTSTANSQTSLSIIPSGTATTSSVNVYGSSDPTNSSRFLAGVISNTTVDIRSDIAGTGTYLPMTFYTGGSERVRIDTSGNVGIGASAGAVKLQVTGASTLGTALLQHPGNNSFGTVLTLETTGGTDDPALSFKNYNGGSPVYYGVSLSDSGALTFNSGQGTGGFGTERMRIDSSGNLLVGVTSSLSSSGVAQVRNTASTNAVISLDATNASYAYTLAYLNTTRGASTAFNFIQCRTDGYAIAQFQVTGNGVIYAQNTTVQSLSDARVKENVRDSDEGLQIILGVKTRRFDFKDGFGNGRKNVLGFIAQEMEEVFPDAVSELPIDPDGEGPEEPYKSVGPAALIPVLVKAIQELNTKLEAQAAEIAALKGAQA